VCDGFRPELPKNESWSVSAFTKNGNAPGWIEAGRKRRQQGRSSCGRHNCQEIARMMRAFDPDVVLSLPLMANLATAADDGAPRNAPV
jgi:hypothetical protein